MTCKYCYQERDGKTGELSFNDDGSPEMSCDIDCLPIRGRVQRLVYSVIYGEATYAEIVDRVLRADPTVAQSNISRALSGLRGKGYVIEGEEDKRLFSTRGAYESGELDVDLYREEKMLVRSKHLRQLLCWYIAWHCRSERYFDLTDKVLINVAALVINAADGAELETDHIYRYMEPLVKKLRYIVGSLQGKHIKVSESLGRLAGLNDWQNKTVAPLKKLKKGSGWKAFSIYFRSEWEQLCMSGNVDPWMLEVALKEENADVHYNIREKAMTPRLLSPSAEVRC